MTGIEHAVRKALCKLLLDEHLTTARRLEALKLANEWAKLRPGQPPVTCLGRSPYPPCKRPVSGAPPVSGSRPPSRGL